jgi:hypothetical protein
VNEGEFACNKIQRALFKISERCSLEPTRINSPRRPNLKQNTVKTLSYAVNAAISFIVISLTPASAQLLTPKIATHKALEITRPDLR